ncbi:MAG: L,D-transpeptidase [Anaerolineae bacterium]|nr:L,D-transpeptidase [Anaerolineae bacterium]
MPWLRCCRVGATARADAPNCRATPTSNGCTAGLPDAQYTLLLDDMVLHPRPEVQFLEVNEREVYRFAYRKLLNSAGTPIFNAPEGQQIGLLSSGDAYVTVEDSAPGWVRINANEWVREGDTQVMTPSTFAGAIIEDAYLGYTLAWVLLPDHPAPYPGAAPDPTRTRFERYTPVYIFAEVEVDGWRWYLVGPNAWIKQTSIGKVIFVDPPEGVKGRWFAVDLYEQVLVAYEGTRPIFATLVSTGLPEYPTLEGTWQTWERLVNTPMDGAEGRTDFYSVENVPYVLYYDGNYALHGAYWHDVFGYRNSRGCVNLSLTDAYWVYEWSQAGGYDLPWVHVFSSGQYAGE